jgi:glyoxylate/hydroxypyruvate reductase A
MQKMSQDRPTEGRNILLFAPTEAKLHEWASSPLLSTVTSILPEDHSRSNGIHRQLLFFHPTRQRIETVDGEPVPESTWTTIVYSVGFRPNLHVLASLPSLEIMFSSGAGVDGYHNPSTYASHVSSSLLERVPLVRLVDPALTQGMVEFVVLHVLAWHRNLWAYHEHQLRHEWKVLEPQILAQQRVIGILGCGVLGMGCARALRALQFEVQLWGTQARTVELMPGDKPVHVWGGVDGLDRLLQTSDCVICLVPLTAETDGLLNQQTLGRMKRGAYVINVGRGRHIVDEDLIDALDKEHLSGATLDVFREEPLPPHHPFWSHPRIHVVPHASALTIVPSAAQTIAAQIVAYEQNGRDVGVLKNVVPHTRHY